MKIAQISSKECKKRANVVKKIMKNTQNLKKSSNFVKIAKMYKYLKKS